LASEYDIFKTLINREMEERDIDDTADENLVFYRDSHINYFKACLDILPHHYVSLDTTRLSAIYFCTLGLDLLGSPLEGADRENVINYIYSNQLIPDKNDESDSFHGRCGFIGSSFCGQPFGECFECRVESTSCTSEQEQSVSVEDVHVSIEPSIVITGDQSNISIDQGRSISNSYLEGNLAMAYTAISTLICLDDDLSRLHKTSLIRSLKSLQQIDGSFSSSLSSRECDLRFVYCACAISSLLNDWSGIDRENVKRFILSCITYEGGMGLTPGAETQGGSTYCAVASLTLLGVLHELGEEALESLLKWCLSRQVNGYNGRYIYRYVYMYDKYI
jgi:geranylgeranyl transferase type-1 subunit beta